MFCDNSHKVLIVAKSLGNMFDKVVGCIRVYHGTRYWDHLALRNMIPFTIESDII